MDDAKLAALVDEVRGVHRAYKAFSAALNRFEDSCEEVEIALLNRSEEESIAAGLERDKARIGLRFAEKSFQEAVELLCGIPSRRNQRLAQFIGDFLVEAGVLVPEKKDGG